MLLYVQPAENLLIMESREIIYGDRKSQLNVFYECVTTASVFLFLAGIFTKFVLTHFRGDQSWLLYRVVKQRNVFQVSQQKHLTSQEMYGSIFSTD